MEKTSEELRLTDLESYDLDNGYPKKQLKSIIKLASNICETPISLIDIIDEFNQRTIATHGDWEEVVIPRDKSICDKVVVDREMLIVDNIESNEEISSRLSEEDKKKIGFYAGAPLISPSGFILGALCIIDSEPRQLSKFQKESLQVLADEVVARLQLHKQTKSLKRQNYKLEKYSIFLNNSADILCIIDSKTNLILDINEDCHKELEFTKDELIGKDFTDYVDSDIEIQKTIKDWFGSEKRKKERLSLPIKLKNKQNEEEWYRCNFTVENDQWYLTARNITDQKKAEERVSALRSKFEKVAEATTDLIYELDWKSAKITWSGDLSRILGYPESKKYVDFEWWQEKIHPDDVEEVMSDFLKVIDSEETKWSCTYRLRDFDGTYKFILNNSQIDRDSNGEPTNILGAIADITQLKKSELLQKNLLSKLQHANHLAELGFWEMDLKDGSILFDDEIFSILGIKNKPKNHSLDLILNRLDNIERVGFLEFLEKLKEGSGISDRVQKIKSSKLREKYLVHRGELIYENGEPRRLLVTTQDITERKLKELRITESLKEKEVLLSEIHHRVKNNLAIISGLLEMNVINIEDEKIIDFVRSSQLRIRSMAKIHENLYQTESFTHISFEDYINDLVETIQNTLSSNGSEPVIKTKIEDVQLNINYAIPCGLILNELITNSWKHAFPNQKKGTIGISFYNEGDKIHLSVKVNGVGLPEGFDQDNVQTSGMILIKILSNQIEADLSIKSSNEGFSCNISFTQKINRKGSSSSFV